MSTVTIVSRLESCGGEPEGIRESISPMLRSLPLDRSEPADCRELPFNTTGAEPLPTKSPLLRLFSFASNLAISSIWRPMEGNLLLEETGRSRIRKAASSRSSLVVSECLLSFGINLLVV